MKLNNPNNQAPRKMEPFLNDPDEAWDLADPGEGKASYPGDSLTGLEPNMGSVLNIALDDLMQMTRLIACWRKSALVFYRQSYETPTERKVGVAIAESLSLCADELEKIVFSEESDHGK